MGPYSRETNKTEKIMKSNAEFLESVKDSLMSEYHSDYYDATGPSIGKELSCDSVPIEDFNSFVEKHNLVIMGGVFDIECALDRENANFIDEVLSYDEEDGTLLIYGWNSNRGNL
jgi:hypothetical protein